MLEIHAHDNLAATIPVVPSPMPWWWFQYHGTLAQSLGLASNLIERGGSVSQMNAAPLLVARETPLSVSAGQMLRPRQAGRFLPPNPISIS